MGKNILDNVFYDNFKVHVSQTERYILEQLLTEQKTGYALAKQSDGQLKLGTVYITLQRMIKKGLVNQTATDVRTNSGLPTQVYTLTHLGLTYISLYKQTAKILFDLWNGK